MANEYVYRIDLANGVRFPTIPVFCRSRKAAACSHHNTSVLGYCKTLLTRSTHQTISLMGQSEVGNIQNIFLYSRDPLESKSYELSIQFCSLLYSCGCRHCNVNRMEYSFYPKKLFVPTIMRSILSLDRIDIGPPPLSTTVLT